MTQCIKINKAILLLWPSHFQPADKTCRDDVNMFGNKQISTFIVELHLAPF